MLDVKRRVPLAPLPGCKRRGHHGPVVVEDFIDEALFQRLLGREPMVAAVHVRRTDFFDRFACACCVNLAHRILNLFEMSDAIFQLGRIAEHIAHRLVDHKLTIAADLYRLAATRDEGRRRCGDAVDIDRNVGRGSM